MKENTEKCRKTPEKNAAKHLKIMPETAYKFAFTKQRILSWKYAGVTHIQDFRNLYKSNRSHADINNLKYLFATKYEKSWPLKYRQRCFLAYIRGFTQIKDNDIHWCAFFPAVLVPYDSFRQFYLKNME